MRCLPGKVRLLFEDEASFGRSNKPRNCWCKKGVRPRVPCQHIREYRHAFGAVEPATGSKIFAVSHKCDTIRMYYFLKRISQAYPDDFIVLVCDGASWHKNDEIVPYNMTIVNLPTGAPEMNPMEQIWREIRAWRGRATSCSYPSLPSWGVSPIPSVHCRVIGLKASPDAIGYCLWFNSGIV